MKNFIFPFLLCIVFLLLSNTSVSAATYYMSPTGVNSQEPTNGTLQNPFKTFRHALCRNGEENSCDNNTCTVLCKNPNYVKAGDTLVLLDGVYYDSIDVRTEGIAGSPITIKAQNEGKAIIDGQFQRVPVLFANWQGDDYFVIEGIVARNGSTGVFYVWGGSNNIFRKVSGYHANPSGNYMVMLLAGSNNHVEDCVMAGGGRKIINLYGASNSSIRRCIAAMGDYVLGSWASGGDSPGIQLYHGQNNIVENVISIGNKSGVGGISMMANDANAKLINNKIVGSVSIYTGMNWDGSSVYLPDGVQYLGVKSGVNIYGSGEVRDNLYKDIFSYGNGGLGFHADSLGFAPSNNRLANATIVNNGLGDPEPREGRGIDTTPQALSSIQVVDSRIDKIKDPHAGLQPPITGAGAKINCKYVDGVLTSCNPSDATNSNNLWPWPMETRIRQEFLEYFGIDYSVTCRVAPILYQYGVVDTNPDTWGCSSLTPFPTPTGPTATPTAIRTPTPTTTPIPLPNGISVSASSFQSPNSPQNTLDGDVNTRWSAQGNGQWIQYQFDSVQTFQSMHIAFYYPTNPESYFDIQISSDGTNWTSLLTNQVGTSAQLQLFDFPDISGQYIRIVGHGSTGSDWNSITEVTFQTQSSTQAGDTDSDGDIDIFDYNTVLSNFGQSVSGANNGDLDNDGDVDIFDYNLVISNFGR